MLSRDRRTGKRHVYVALPAQDLKIGPIEFLGLAFFTFAGTSKDSRISEFDGLLTTGLFGRIVFSFDDVEVREREFTLTKAGKVLAVEPKAFRTLLFLLRNPQRLISKEELLNSVWGDTAVAEGSLTRCVWLLRGVLGDDIRNPRYIETVATVGYRFIAKVKVSEDASGDPQATKEPKDLSDSRQQAGSCSFDRYLA